MREYRTETKEEKVLSAIVCNCCGMDIPLEKADHFHAEKKWGYFSGKDGRQDSFDLCEACYDRLTASFAVKMK